MSNAPPGKPHDNIFEETTWLQGALFTAMGYGVVMTLFVMCFRLLLRQTTKSNWRRQRAYLTYISIMFAMGTLYCISLFIGTQLSFINNRHHHGGPAAYEAVIFSRPFDVMGNAAYVIANWLADGLMIWRCLVIYTATGCRISLWLVMIIPYLMYACSFAMGIVWLARNSYSSQSALDLPRISYTVPYLSLSLALNILVTTMIVLRLLYHRHSVRKSLGPSYGSHYTSVATMIVESAALYSTFSLLLILSYGLQNPMQNLFMQLLGEIQVIAALLIVFHVAQGKAYSHDDVERGWNSQRLDIRLGGLSALRFANSPAPSIDNARGTEISSMAIDTSDPDKEIDLDTNANHTCEMTSNVFCASVVLGTQ